MHRYLAYIDRYKSNTHLFRGISGVACTTQQFQAAARNALASRLLLVISRSASHLYVYHVVSTQLPGACVFRGGDRAESK